MLESEDALLEDPVSPVSPLFWRRASTFLQGTSEKIHLQGLLGQKLLQAMDFLAVSRCVCAGP